MQQSSLADFAKLLQQSSATSPAAFLAQLPTGPTRMVRVEASIESHLLTGTGFIQRTEAANWLNVAALIATLFCLLSFFILPVKWTHRHYLSICLAIAVAFMEVWLLPLSERALLILQSSLLLSPLDPSPNNATTPSHLTTCDPIIHAPLVAPFSSSAVGRR
jgi:hypothetical protein